VIAIQVARERGLLIKCLEAWNGMLDESGVKVVYWKMRRYNEGVFEVSSLILEALVPLYYSMAWHWIGVGV
jgi:hypothetical protein